MTGVKSKNSDLPRHVTKAPSGAYKYQRRVPKDLHDFLGRSKWEHSLGTDPTSAFQRAAAYATKHDQEISRYQTPEARTESDTFRATMGQALTRNEEDLSEIWREAPTLLKEARALPPHLERDRLAVFAAQAFSDGRYLQQKPVTSPGAVFTIVEFPTISMPTDPTDALMFNAYRAALDARLAQIAPAESSDPMRLSVLMAAYSKAQATRLNTVNGYRRKVERLVKFADDRGLQHYDEATLRGYRDYLLEGDPAAKPHPYKPVKPVTVHQYFAPLKAMWKWAADEYPEHQELTFPRIRLPKDGDTVEDTRWQAFDDKQIKHVWKLVNDAWGPKAKSKLSPSRRKAFLMAIRVLLYTGMRPAEVFRLTAADVSNGVISIRYTKTKTPRKIPLSIHLADFPDFLAEGGFAAELEAGMTAMHRGKVYGKPTTPQSLAGTLSDNFAPIIRAGGLTNDRHVCYSCKDTLIDRLQQQGASDDVMRGIIGHVGGQGKLRHYKTPFGHSPHGMAQMRKALDKIVYW